LSLQDRIRSLQKERDAIILAHNYQIPEIQDIADYLGDSLELSIKASKTEQPTILFCGVTFMAETAKILSPEKEVLIPRRDARCPMADMVTPEDVLRMRKNHPSAAVVSYVNTNVEVKAVSDICCTSANAVKVVESLEADDIIFLPDEHLANYVATQTSKTIIPWKGFCHVHRRIRRDEILEAKRRNPSAVLLVHPECTTDVLDIADEVLSTGGMVRYAKESDATEFLIGTEEGLIHRLRKENPTKKFLPAGTPRICTSMKKIRLDDVARSLSEGVYKVEVEEKVRAQAGRALKRMTEIS
jgi:quinolinate synthase